MIKKEAAIITLDIVNSSKLSKEQLQQFIVLSIKLPQCKFIDRAEVYRGDGIQTYTAKAQNGLEAMLYQYCFFKMEQIQVRQSLGLGSITDLHEDSLAKSNGIAFQLSGRALDGMKKKHLLIQVNFENASFNKEWQVHSSVLSDLIESWSEAQAEAVQLSLTGDNQTDIATKLGISQAAVHHRLKSAKMHLLQQIINRYKEMM